MFVIRKAQKRKNSLGKKTKRRNRKKKKKKKGDRMNKSKEYKRFCDDFRRISRKKGIKMISWIFSCSFDFELVFDFIIVN